MFGLARNYATQPLMTQLSGADQNIVDEFVVLAKQVDSLEGTDCHAFLGGKAPSGNSSPCLPALTCFCSCWHHYVASSPLSNLHA